MSLTTLPTELQLEIVEKLPSRSLSQLLFTNSYLNALCLSSINSKINDITQNNQIYISVYSPQVHHHLVETFNTICLSNPSSELHTPKYANSRNCAVDLDQVSRKLQNLNQSSLFENLQKNQSSGADSLYKTLFQLGKLESTYNPLDITKTESEVNLNNYDNSRHLRLLVNEDEPQIKLHFEMKYKHLDSFKSVVKFNTKLTPNSHSGTLFSSDKTLSLDYKLTLGDEAPPKSPYDYEVFNNYLLEVDNIQINTLYLIDRTEN